MRETLVIFQKPCLEMTLDLQGNVKVPATYYNAIAPILYELGVPPQTIPVLAKATEKYDLRLVQEAAQREDLEQLAQQLISKAEEHIGPLPGKIVVYLSEIFDHYAWASQTEWVIVMRPAFDEDFESHFQAQLAHNLIHCARYAQARNVYLNEANIDFFNVDNRRQFRVNMPLAEDIINEGLPAVGARLLMKHYPRRELRAPWYNDQITRILQEFVGVRNVTGQERVLFMGDRSAVPLEEHWQNLPRELVFVGYFLGWFLATHAFEQAHLPFKTLLEKSANELLSLGFAHLRQEPAH